jgi:hypothetical protein
MIINDIKLYIDIVLNDDNVFFTERRSFPMNLKEAIIKKECTYLLKFFKDPSNSNLL